MARLPAQGLPPPRDVYLVMIVGVLDHPRLDVGLLIQNFFLHDRAKFRDALGKDKRLPLLAMKEMTDALLHLSERFICVSTCNGC